MSSDLEAARTKEKIPDNISSSTSTSEDGLPPSTHSFSSTLKKWNARIESLAGLEARGISRVLPSERQPASLASDVQLALLWFSANLTVNNAAVALLGPLVFNLGFLDSALCSVFGALLGSCFTAYMSIWGAQSGNRTMVVARYFMGYWPSKICCLLNIVIMVGYGLIDSIIGGQILSAVSGGSLSIVVGIVIVAIITWVVALLGMSIFHSYSRWAWLPQLIVLFILFGSAGPHFNTSLPSLGSSSAIAANRLSFFSLSLTVPVTWAAAASDFYVYYPASTSTTKIFLLTATGLILSYTIVNLIGVGLASGIASHPSWNAAYNISSGALFLAGYEALGGFGKFCGVVIALGVISNNIPGTYAAALNFQMLGRYPKLVPRYLWTCVVVGIYLVCAVVAWSHLFLIFQNFLALMGYWVTIFLSIVVEEHVLFRKWRGPGGFDWSAWEDQSRLPRGYAALTAFLAGWAGSVVSMYQVYYVGPIAKLVGADGADLGIWVGSGIALVVFPPLRLLELRVVGR